MMKHTSLFILLATLIMSACAPASTPTLVPSATPLPTSPPALTATATATPTATSTPTATPFLISTRLPTATSTSAVGRIPTPTSGPEGEGYALEFTHQVSSGFAILHGSAHTCSGIRGSWEGTFEVELDYERMHISGSGPFNFTLPADQLTVRGEAPFSGGGAVSGTRCVILGVSDPLRFEITFSEDGRTAAVIMGSVGGGTITVQCPDSPAVTIPFAVAWGPEPLTVPVTAYDGCP